MNLIELFDSLSVPEEGNENVFNAIPIPEYQYVRVAINIEGSPVLLLSVTNRLKNIPLKNFRLKYLNLTQNLKCKIIENGNTSDETFTIITFNCRERHLQEYFLRISESFIKSLQTKPSQEQVLETINEFVEIFRSLTDPPTNTIQGLWAELFLIEVSQDPKNLLSYWHNIPEEKFDFNSGVEKIEVKSSSNFERIHTFSCDQLNPKEDSQVLIASIFVRQNHSGCNIQDLIESIVSMMPMENELIDKLNRLVIKTLGSLMEHSINIKFDCQIARDSLRYYKHQDIKKIEEANIPAEVSDVRFKSDLSEIESIEILKLPQRGRLFNSI